MTEKEQFEFAIQSSPDDKQLKLVFADWLEERGMYGEAEFWKWLMRTNFKPFSGTSKFHIFPDSWDVGPKGRRYGDLPDEVFKFVDCNDYYNDNVGKHSHYSSYDFRKVWLQTKQAWVKAYNSGWRPAD